MLPHGEHEILTISSLSVCTPDKQLKKMPAPTKSTEAKAAAVVANQACCFPGGGTVKKAVEVVKAAQAVVPPVVAVPEKEAPSATCSFLGITACMSGPEAPAVQAVEGVKSK